MVQVVRQSTAITRLIGPVIDADGVAVTNEVVGNLKITKNGVVSALHNSASLTHNHAGKYLLTLTVGDLDTIGEATISLDDGENDMPPLRLQVIEEQAYDYMYASGATPTNGIGSGADTCTITITVEGNPVPDADVWITSDASGSNVVEGTKQTNSNGKVAFLLDDGNTYYLWMQKDGYNSILGQQFTAVAD